MTDEQWLQFCKDLAGILTADQRREFMLTLRAHHERDMPGSFKRMWEEILDETTEMLLRQQAAAPPPRPPAAVSRKITRQGHHLPTSAPPAPTPPVRAPAPPPLRDNVVPLSPPLPRGSHPVITATLAPQAGNAGDVPAVRSGGVHRDVLYRSTLPPHLAAQTHPRRRSRSGGAPRQRQTASQAIIKLPNPSLVPVPWTTRLVRAGRHPRRRPQL